MSRAPATSRRGSRIARSPEAFVENARRLMAAQALTIHDIAKGSYLDKMKFYRLFQGGNCMLDVAIEIADALGTTIDELAKHREPEVEAR